MKKEEFRDWLKNTDGRSNAQTSDHISRIKRIENAFTELDGKKCDVEIDCQKNNGEKLLKRLSLESRKTMPETINLPVSSMGMARLRSSLRKYIEFYNWKTSLK